MFDQNPMLSPGTSTFSSHLIEILLMLLVAFILGWLLRKFLSDSNTTKGVDDETYRGVLNDNKSLKAKISSLETNTTKYDKLQMRINELEAQNNSLIVFRDNTDKNNSLKLEFDNLKTEHAKLLKEQTALYAIKDKYTNLEAENIALADFETKYLRLKKDYDSLKESNDKSYASASNASNSSATAVTMGAVALAATTNYDVLNTNANSNVSDSEIQKLQEEVEKYKKNLEKFKEYEAENRENAGLKGRMAIMEEEARELKKMANKAAEADTYLAKIADLEAQVSSIKTASEANAQAGIDLASANNKVLELEKKVAAYNSNSEEIKNLKSQVLELSQANDVLAVKINEKSAEISQANFDKDKIAALELQAASAMALLTTNENMKQEISSLQLRINEGLNRESDCKRMVAELSSKVSSLENATLESKPTNETIASNSIDSTPIIMAASASIKSDDLKIVEGIGPKIEELLHNVGILTFDDLAKTPAETVKEILLRDGGERYRIHDPKTWGYQAELARDGKWDELKKLQDELTAGRDTNG